jgi:DNA-binding response OmpR family regulator
MPGGKARILVVEDDEALRAVLVKVLSEEGYEVHALADGSGVAQAKLAFRPDLAVLDVRLGAGPDGLAVAQSLRDASDLSVVFLTAAGDEADRLAGFRAGADDYVPKPFSVPELVARIQAVLRRSGREVSTAWQVGDLVADEAGRTVFRGDVPVELTRTEFEILCALHRHLGQVLSKTDLLSEVWGYDAYDPNVVEVHISSLRRKLEAAGGRLVHTVRGAGYVLRG